MPRELHKSAVDLNSGWDSQGGVPEFTGCGLHIAHQCVGCHSRQLVTLQGVRLPKAQGGSSAKPPSYKIKRLVVEPGLHGSEAPGSRLVTTPAGGFEVSILQNCEPYFPQGPGWVDLPSQMQSSASKDWAWPLAVE